MFKPRQIAKSAVNITVAGATSAVVDSAVRANIENPEEHDTVITAGSLAAGWYVASRTRRITDPMVDKIANWRLARKENKSPATAE